MYCVQLPKYITITLHFVTTFNQDSGNHDISDGNVHITIRNRLFLSVMIMLMRRGFRESGFSILLGWLPCPKPGCCTQTCSFTLVKTNAAIEVDDDANNDMMLIKQNFQAHHVFRIGWLLCSKHGCCCTQTCSLSFYETKMKLLILIKLMKSA